MENGRAEFHLKGGGGGPEILEGTFWDSPNMRTVIFLVPCGVA